VDQYWRCPAEPIEFCGVGQGEVAIAERVWEVCAVCVLLGGITAATKWAISECNNGHFDTTLIGGSGY
jgi:hypothetical protein